MKLSRPNIRLAHAAPAEVQRFLDDEIAKIVADINDHRPPKKPRGARSRAPHGHAKAA